MICSASARKIGVVAAGAFGAIGALCVSDDAVVVLSAGTGVEAGAFIAELEGTAATLSTLRVSRLPDEYASDANNPPVLTRANARISRMEANARKDLSPALRSKIFGKQKFKGLDCQHLRCLDQASFYRERGEVSRFIL